MKPLCDPAENVRISDPEYGTLNGKSVYAFGDSIVYGHKTPEKSFMCLASDEYGMTLGMYAKNGATIVTTDSCSKEDPNEETSNNYIINQIKAASDEKPDMIVFDGYTNDAYGDPATDSFNSTGAHVNIWEHLGEIQGISAASFDTSTFCGGFEKIIYEMKNKWQDVPIVFVTIHKSGGRDWDTQCKLRELAIEICEKWDVSVADVFEDAALDTRNADEMEQYIIDGAGSHPNVSACREFYIPIVCKAMISTFEKASLPDNVTDTVDLAIFAEQSNMSGRDGAADATVCDVNVGFEYKSVSDPTSLLPITEPFDLGYKRNLLS